MSAYYNEFEPYAAHWLRTLIKAGHIAPGDVDERDIREVKADELRGYKQCHFFAGIGGWSVALRQAMWEDDRPVWTGSCPCQPFSDSGNRSAQQDERHLWPNWARLIRESSPATIFGEQVASAIAYGWLDEVGLEMEAQGYAFAAVVLPACASGAPHIRERVWFVAHNTENGRKSEKQEEGHGWSLQSNALSIGICSENGKWASEGYKPPLPLLAHGIPGRMGAFKGYGNAIVPQVAAGFIKAAMLTDV